MLGLKINHKKLSICVSVEEINLESIKIQTTNKYKYLEVINFKKNNLRLYLQTAWKASHYMRVKHGHQHKVLEIIDNIRRS